MCFAYCFPGLWTKQEWPYGDVLFVGERSDTYSHKDTTKWFRFSRPWHPSALNLFKSKFLSTYWSDWYNFWKNTTTGSRTIISQMFGRRNFFASYWQTNSISGFFRRQRLHFWTCLYSKIANAVFAPIDGIHSCWAACCVITFLRPDFAEKSKNLWFFQKLCDIPLVQRVCHIWRRFSPSAQVKIVSLLLSSICKVVIDRGKNFRQENL